MKNVLVTGGAGFIGSNFVRFLLRKRPGVHIVVLDALTYAGSLKNLAELPENSKIDFQQGDICNQELVEDLLGKQRIDTLVHFAAETHVDRSIQSPRAFVETNLVGTYSLLEASRKVWGENDSRGESRFHHVSTDEVYGSLEPDAPPAPETAPYLPNSPYAASKAGSDHLARAYFHTYGLPVTISNCSNNYGPYQFPEKLIPLIILNALHGKPLPVYGDGQQVRDWLYVEDHCAAILRILEAGKTGHTYNIGGGNQPPNLDLVLQICSLLDEYHPAGAPHDRLVTHVEDRPGHDRRYALDTTSIREELGWEPEYSLNKGLRLTVNWYLHHQEWLDAISHLHQRERGNCP